MIILQDKAVTPPTKSVPEIGTTNKIILFLFTSHHLRQTCVYEHGRDLSPSLFGEVEDKDRHYKRMEIHPSRYLQKATEKTHDNTNIVKESYNLIVRTYISSDKLTLHHS